MWKCKQDFQPDFMVNVFHASHLTSYDLHFNINIYVLRNHITVNFELYHSDDMSIRLKQILEEKTEFSAC